MSSGDSRGSLERSRYLPSRRCSALIAAWSMRSSPPVVTRRNRLRPGLVEIWPGQLGPFGDAEGVAAVDAGGEPVDELITHVPVTFGLFGVVTIGPQAS